MPLLPLPDLTDKEAIALFLTGVIFGYIGRMAGDVIPMAICSGIMIGYGLGCIIRNRR